MKQIKQQLLLTVALLLCGIGIANAKFYTGSCGTNVTYTLETTTGELKISGRGEMTNWTSLSNVPWYSNLSSIKSVFIFDGVTSIGSYAFCSCSRLTSVTIPNSVTSIGSDAFSWCSGLTSVTIPNSVTEIGSHAFEYCMDLTSVKLGSNVTEIGYRTFKNCFHLASVNIPNGLTYIEDEAFDNCGLTYIYIPSSVTFIGNNAFRNCDFTRITVGAANKNYDSRNSCNAVINKSTNELIVGCESTIIPNSVTSIGSYAFSCCYGLTSVTIPNSVTSIGSYAFCYCSRLTSVTIPNSVRSIGGSAFEGCSGLTSVVWNPKKCADLPSYIFPKTVKNITFGDEVESIPSYLCYNMTSLTSVTIPNRVTTIGMSAFEGCFGLTSVTVGNSVTNIADNAFLKTNNIKKTIWLGNTPPTGYEYLKSAVNYASNNSYKALSNVKVYPYLSSMFEVDGIKYIITSPAERTCDAVDCDYSESKENINIGETVSYKGVSLKVNNVNDYIFYNKKNIESVHINCNGNLGGYVLSGSESLKEVVIHNKGAIGERAFENCTNLASVKLTGATTDLGAYAFYNCGMVPELTIPTSVIGIGTYCFYGCSALKNIIIPSNVTKIDNYAFKGCTSIKNVTMLNHNVILNLGSNGSSALFADCPLDSVYIGGKIIYNTSSDCGYSPFYSNMSLRAITIADKEERVYDNEFYGCKNLTNVHIGDNVTSIGKYAFSGCTSLQKFSFGKSVKTIGNEAFSDCTALVRLVGKASVPPTCGSQALEDISKWECTLYVPAESKAAYMAADQWRDFFFVEDFVEPIKGDVDGDGKLTKSDAVMIMNAYLGIDKSIDSKVADVNGDGVVNIQDANIIVNKYLGK